MLRLKTIAAAGLAMGLSVVAPSFAKADHVRADDRRDVRVETRDFHGREGRIERDVRVERDIRVDRDWHRDHGGVRIEVGPVYAPPVYVPAPVYVAPNVDLGVALGNVPSCVLNTVAAEARGPIETARFVRQDGFEFYRFIVAGRDGRNLDVHVGVDGRLISMTAC